MKIGWNFKFGKSIVCTILEIERKSHNMLFLKHEGKKSLLEKPKCSYLFVVNYRSNSKSEDIVSSDTYVLSYTLQNGKHKIVSSFEMIF